jgi:hypothetical protein
LSFTFRDEKQYGILEDTTFMLVETPWQRLMRNSNSGESWKETAVKSNSGSGDETMPFPGFTFTTKDARFITVTSRFYDDANGRPFDRKDKEYPDIEHKDPDRKILQEEYRVSVNVQQ